MRPDPFLEAQSRARAAPPLGWRAELLRAQLPDDAARLTELLDRGRVTHVHDAIDDQLRELVRALEPSQRLTGSALDAAARAHLGRTPAHDYGVWAFYPWSGRLVHLLDAEELAIVRTDRNRNKITREEQARLAELRVGVIGLSVGQSVCLALTLERGYGELRIADFDELALSNLNRIRAPLHRLGLNKAVAVAREIAELDPFLDVVVYEHGITRGNLDAFLTEGGKLDVLVEECDGIGIKLLARTRARALGIAVVMDTSDRGMIDIERFDREPERPILHGLVEHLDPEAAMHARTDEEKLPFVAPILGLDTLSPRMKASMLEIDETVTTWPQLGSAVLLGGALTADVVRRIALDQLRCSGRWFIDLEQLVADGPPAASAHPRAIEPAPALSRACMLGVSARIAGCGELREAQARQLAQAAAMAPSAGNLQPWRCLFDRGRLLLFHDPAASQSVFDPESMIAHIGLGAAIENVVLAAGTMGFALRHQLLPLADEPRLCAIFELAPASAPLVDPLAAQLDHRCTNRRHGEPEELALTERRELLAAAASIAGARLHLVSGRAPLGALAELCGRAEQIRFLHEAGHAELFGRELRWPSGGMPPREGLDVDTLELDASERTGLRMAADPRVVALLRRWHGGSGFTSLAGDAIRSSSAMALLTIDAPTPAARLSGGRAAQRMWLAATACELAVHPVSAPVFLALAARHDGVFEDAQRDELTTILARTLTIFDAGEREPLFMVRLAHAGPPSVRSLRRPLEHTFEAAP